MSHTSEPVPLSLGAIFTYWSLCESKTARFETLATTVPLRCLTWVNLPPSQMLAPTCSIARTVPLTIGVLSGVPEGKASATPQAKSTPRVIEASSRMILLISISFFDGAEEKDEPSTPSYVIISKYLNIYQHTTSSYLTLLRPHLATTSRSWRLISTSPIPRRITGGSAECHRLAREFSLENLERSVREEFC